MFYKIVELRTQKKIGHAYIRVDFWRTKIDFDSTKPPYLTEDFLMQLRPAVHDLPVEIRATIKRYIVRANLHNYEGDNSSHLSTAAKDFRVKGQIVRKRGDRIYIPIIRDEVDKYNVLTIEVKALRNTTKEELSDSP